MSNPPTWLSFPMVRHSAHFQIVSHTRIPSQNLVASLEVVSSGQSCCSAINNAFIALHTGPHSLRLAETWWVLYWRTWHIFIDPSAVALKLLPACLLVLVYENLEIELIRESQYTGQWPPSSWPLSFIFQWALRISRVLARNLKLCAQH